MTRITRSGSYSLDHSVEEVFQTLATPEDIVRCLPDSTDIKGRSESSVEVSVKTGTPVVSIHLDLTISLEKADRETGMIRYVGRGSGPRSYVRVSGSFQLREEDTGTTVEWDGEVVIHGMLVALGEQTGRYAPIIDDKIETTVANVQQEVMTHDA